MKLLKYISAILFIGSMTACSLDETIKSELDQEAVYTTSVGFDGLINACYENLYYLYGKEDGIPLMEACDLWQNGSVTSSSWKEGINNYQWNTETGYNRVVWNALYATIAYCNTAIYYKDFCPDSPEVVNQKVAEAYFMRGFSYFHIVEQWGGVTLTTQSMAEVGAREFAYRNTEEEIYDQIISDLTFAYNNLPESQGANRGRATKGAATAMLVKAWMQRSRLERDLAENPNQSKWKSIITTDSKVKYTAAQCAENAYKYAQEVFNTYELYTSTAEQSGSSQVWDGANNKSNKEFIFVEAVDHENGKNPEAWNRGRTRQYYLMSISSAAADFGVSSDGLRYGRANTSRVHPTLYLLTECFDPRPSRTDVKSIVYDGVSKSASALKRENDFTPDTRFNDSFYYKYYIGASSYPLAMALFSTYSKDTVYFAAVESRRKISGNIATPEELKAEHPGLNYYADNGRLSGENMNIELEDKPGALGCYTPNFPVDSAWAAQKKFLVAGTPGEATTGKFNIGSTECNTGIFRYMEADGNTAKSSAYRSLCPSLKKLSPIQYIMTNQQSLNDFPIIRLTDIYLLAAEAALLSSNISKSDGLNCLNIVRRHAALAGDASLIEVSDYDMDFLVKERARELCGENWRWYDLKRMGYLTSAHLNTTNIYCQPYQTKWRVRPIPQQLLDQIANPEEYGTNGY